MGTHKRALRQVERAFDSERLIDICERDETEFEEFGTVVAVEPIVKAWGDSFYIYKDNGADILAIAHLDTVQGNRGATVTETKTGSKIVLSGALDDRLGAYVILDLLPKLGVKTDWLLTTGEESCSSTGVDFARHHKANGGKQYKWMFQFDRTGTDVVMYDYENPESLRLLRSVGFQIGQGSFSDISDMDALGCVGFNFGVGYQDYHSLRAYAWLEDTFNQVARFLRFYRKYGDRAMPHVMPEWLWDEYTDNGGNVHKFRYRPNKGRQWDFDDEPWEETRDRYLAKQSAKKKRSFAYDANDHAKWEGRVRAMPGTLTYSDRECVCGCIESNHDNGGECMGLSCGCVEFVDLELAQTQEQGLTSGLGGYN